MAFALQMSVAFDRAALLPAHLRADQHQRELVGEQFVIGEPLPRRRLRRQIGFVRRRMCARATPR